MSYILKTKLAGMWNVFTVFIHQFDVFFNMGNFFCILVSVI